MPKIDVLDKTKSVVGSISLSDAIFAAEVKEPVVHQVVVAQQAARRRGTQATKQWAEVSGGGKKPWKQKGTGRARTGSIRAPHWRGGAVVLGPQPRSYEQSVNKKMRRVALTSTLTSIFNEGRLVVVDNLTMDAIKTKAALQLLTGLGKAFPMLVVTGAGCENFTRGVRNVPTVKTLPVEGVNAYDLLNCNTVVVTRDAVEGIEKRLTK